MCIQIQQSIVKYIDFFDMYIYFNSLDSIDKCIVPTFIIVEISKT